MSPNSNSPTVYLISRSNGIGIALVHQLASNRPNAIVFAGTHEPSLVIDLQAYNNHPSTAQDTYSSSNSYSLAADIVKNQSVVKEIQEKFGKVDIVIVRMLVWPSLVSFVFDATC